MENFTGCRAGGDASEVSGRLICLRDDDTRSKCHPKQRAFQEETSNPLRTAAMERETSEDRAFHSHPSERHPETWVRNRYEFASTRRQVSTAAVYPLRRRRRNRPRHPGLL